MAKNGVDLIKVSAPRVEIFALNLYWNVLCAYDSEPYHTKEVKQMADSINCMLTKFQANALSLLKGSNALHWLLEASNSCS